VELSLGTLSGFDEVHTEKYFFVFFLSFAQEFTCIGELLVPALFSRVCFIEIFLWSVLLHLWEGEEQRESWESKDPAIIAESQVSSYA
jgi:hypothetical protein